MFKCNVVFEQRFANGKKCSVLPFCLALLGGSVLSGWLRWMLMDDSLGTLLQGLLSDPPSKSQLRCQVLGALGLHISEVRVRGLTSVTDATNQAQG